MKPYPIEIAGKHVVLKTLEPNLKNASAVYDLMQKNAAYLKPFCGWIASDDDTVLKTLHALRRADNLRQEDDTALYYIFHNAKMIGSIKALMYPHERELRFWLDNEAKGKGLMQESILLMEKMLFDRNHDRIILSISNKNIPSLNLAKKLGYTEDWQGYFEMTFDNFKKSRDLSQQERIDHVIFTAQNQR